MATVVQKRGSTGLVAAWMFLLLFLPCFFGAFVVGEGLISLLGYDFGRGEMPPAWVAIAATTPALLVFALPLWPTWHFGRIARDEGAHGAMIPFAIAVALVSVFVLLNVMPLGAPR